MKNHHKIKLIAASVALMTSFTAVAGLGGLNVQSHLGEPFSGTITVTGEEAKTLLNGGKASISNGNLRASIRKSGGDSAVVTIRSSKPIQDPVLIFQVGVGSQSREYTAIIDPAGYTSKTDGSTRVRTQNNRVEAAPADAAVERNAARERINRAVSSDKADAVAKGTQSRRSADAKQQAKAAKPKSQEYSGIVYGKRHLVRQGETLTGIASRIRPQGMTLAQTVDALVNANPDVFVGNDANRMLAGKVLNIPTRNELQNHISTPASTSTSTVAQVEQPAASAEAASSQANVVSPSQVAASDNAVSAPAEVATSAVASDSAPVIQASAVQTSTPAVETPAVSDTEESSGLWRWLLLGGAGLIALLLLSKLLAKRKDSADDELLEPVSQVDEDKEKVEPEFSGFGPLPEAEQSFGSDSDNNAKAAAAVIGAGAVAATAAAVKKPNDELEVEDDFGDDIFFTEVESVPTAQHGDVDFDLNALDNTQEAIVSGAVTRDEETEKRRDADWDSIESTESVYEPEPENPYAVHSAETAAAEARESLTDTFSTSAASQPEVHETWDFGKETQENDTKAAEEEWDFFAEEQPVAKESQADKEIKSVEAVEEKWDFFADETETNQAAQEDGAIEFVTEDIRVEQEAIHVSAAESAAEKATDHTQAFEFEAPAVAVEDEPLEFVAPQIEEVSEVRIEETTPDLAYTAAADSVVGGVENEISAEPELFNIQQAETLAFQDAEDLNAEVTQVTEAEADDGIEWDNIAVAESVDSSRRDTGFISESVGMTAPLEAKYELAKMYVEIGDPEAARETLQELLEESSGSILSKAKAMLKELEG